MLRNSTNTEISWFVIDEQAKIADRIAGLGTDAVPACWSVEASVMAHVESVSNSMGWVLHPTCKRKPGHDTLLHLKDIGK